MATPPPEATSVLKEEKPQLPPSPNGVSSDETAARAGVLDPVTDVKPDIHTNGAEKPTETPTETPADTVNGHGLDQPSVTGTDQPSTTNGVNVTPSPPKSPTLSSTEAATKPTPPVEEPKLPSVETPATEEGKTGMVEDKPAVDQPIVSEPVPEPVPEPIAEPVREPVSEPAKETSPDKATPQEIQTPQDTPKLSVDPGSAPPTESTPQPSTEPASEQTELPHHPLTPAKPESVAGMGVAAAESIVPPPLQSVDQEMRDAPDVPLSPTKLSREREPDTSEEPAAKRTKVDSEGPASNDDFKIPSLPVPSAGTPTIKSPTAEAPVIDAPLSPTTQAPAGTAANGASGITKMQHKFMLKGVQSLKRMNDSRFYREPVDPIKLNIPHYVQIIQRPMDLGTIERRLKANEYKSADAVVQDFHLMVQNAATFNGPDHVVSQEGQKLKATFDKQMLNLPKPDEVEEKKPKKVSTKTSAARREPRVSAGVPQIVPPRPAGESPQSTTFALGPEGLPLIRRDSSNADGRPKRSIHPPKRDLPYSTKPKKKKYQWELKFCQEVLDDLYKSKHYTYAMPFYYPVDPVALNIPTYHSVIKKPMDLSTIQSKLKTGQYENAKEFELDLRQIFKNCFKFNIVGDPTYAAGQKLEEVFNGKWAQKGRYLEAHEPHPEHQSVDSSEEESEEEAEESDEDEERLTLLQKQMAEMTRQVEAIMQKKKKTPPRSKKATKSKAGKKDAVAKKGGSSSARKDKKSAKGGKPEKQRWVSYHEKQIISNGISELPDKKMQEALKIIQSNVPALKGTQETEIELDIDELPNDVLLMLLKFVKKNAPQVMEDEDVAVSATNPAAPKPKKNKPMSKFEQEAQINMLSSNLSRFQGGGTGRSPDLLPSVEANESSDDDSEDDSEESEEE